MRSTARCPRARSRSSSPIRRREQAVIEGKAAGYNVIGNPRPAVTNYVAQHQINEGTYPSLAVLVRKTSASRSTQYGSLAKVPADTVGNTRNDMYLVSEAIRFLMKDKESDLSAMTSPRSTAYKGSLDSATKFIPTWVKIASPSRSASAP
jgi:PiT family inorganic phosphate transporter